MEPLPGYRGRITLKSRCDAHMGQVRGKVRRGAGRTVPSGGGVLEATEVRILFVAWRRGAQNNGPRASVVVTREGSASAVEAMGGIFAGAVIDVAVAVADVDRGGAIGSEMGLAVEAAWDVIPSCAAREKPTKEERSDTRSKRLSPSRPR